MTHQFSRRDLLAAFLGAPAFLSGCKEEPAVALPPGELVGASDKVGHRLRDTVTKPPVDLPRQQTKVVIVGGGIAGFSAARQLLRNGIDDFVLLELENQPGGTSRSGESDIVGYPWAAHYVPAPTIDNQPLINLLDELDVFEGRDPQGNPIVAEQFRCRFPDERVFFKGTWYEGLYLAVGATKEDLRQFKAFQDEVGRLVDWRDDQGRRAFAIPVANSTDDPQITDLDRITIAEWMGQRGFTSSRLRWYINYACRDDYGMTIDQTSAWAALFYFAARKFTSSTESQPFITWPEGNGRIIRHLYQSARKQTRLGMAVANINPGESNIDVLAIDHDGRPTGFQCDHVIFTAPQFLAKYVIQPYRQAVPAHVAAFDYGSWMVANLTVATGPHSRGFPMAWDNVLYESPSLGYVSATHQRGIDYGPSVLTYYYPLCDDDSREARNRLLSVDRDGWADIALTDLAIAHPGLREQCQRVDVMRWGHAMIKPKPNFIHSADRIEAAKPFRGIHFANTDLSGVALMEEAFYHGMRAADEVIQASGTAT